MTEFLASGAGWTCKCGRRNHLGVGNWSYVCKSCGATWCLHCDDIGPVGEDHTCPCPWPDDKCPDHIAWWENA